MIETKRGTQKEMFERRNEMLNLYKSGMNSSEFMPIIANKHQVSEDAVKKDWSNRPNWIKYFMNVEEQKS